MTIKNNRIELTPDENKIFIHLFKNGIIHQFYLEKLLTNEQVNQVLRSINS